MIMSNGTSQFITPSMKNALDIDTSKTVHLLGWDLKPSSRGEIYPVSGQTGSLPIIKPNFFTTTDDIENSIDMMIFMYNIFSEMRTNQVSGDNFELIWPPEQLFVDADRDGIFKAILAFPNIAQHWVGTCKMAPLGNDDSQQGVVDENLAVYGVTNLMVVDSSIMPTISTGTTSGPTLAIAGKGAAICLGTLYD